MIIRLDDVHHGLLLLPHVRLQVPGEDEQEVGEHVPGHEDGVVGPGELPGQEGGEVTHLVPGEGREVRLGEHHMEQDVHQPLLLALTHLTAKLLLLKCNREDIEKTLKIE